MFGPAIDRLSAKSPAFEKYFTRIIDTLYRTSPAAEAGAFAAAAFSAGISAVYGNDTIFIISLTVTAAVWLQTAFSAGFLNRWLSAGALLLYFWLPGLFILPKNTELTVPYGITGLLDDLSVRIWASPVLRIVPDADITSAMLILLAAEAVAFLAGMRMRRALKSSAVYCRIRLKQLDEISSGSETP